MARLYPNLNEPWSDVDDEEPPREDSMRDEKFYYGRESRETPRERSGPAHSSRHNYSNMSSSGNREFTDTVSLSEFEDHFLKYRQTPGQNHSQTRKMHSEDTTAASRVTGGHSSISISHIVSCGRDIASQSLQWVVGASLWKKAVLGSALGLMCAVLLSILRAQVETPSKGM